MLDRDISAKIDDIATHYQKERDFWLNKLSGEIVKSIFPYDHEPFSEKEQMKDENEMNPAAVEFTVKGKLYSRLLNLSKRNDYALHVILAAALVVLLEKYTGNKDILVGSPIYRQEVDAEFINTTLVLRNQIKENMSFKEFLLQVNQTIEEADENQNYPIEKLVKDLDLEMPGEDFPLFDGAILVENIHEWKYIRDIPHHITFSFLRTDKRIKGILRYHSSRYEKETLKRIINHFINLLEGVLVNPDVKVSEIDILSKAERQQILFHFNDTRAEYPGGRSLPRLFEEQERKTPDHMAVVGTTQIKYRTYMTYMTYISYRELNEKSRRLAHLLKEKGVKPDTIVGVMAERSLEMVIGILAILKAGAAYLPIDPDYPEERINYMLADSKVNILVKKGNNFSDFFAGEGLEVISIDDISLYTALPSHLHLSPAPVTSLAYIIYTSGSTGKPKGVMVEHISVVNILWAMQKAYPFMESDVYLFKTAYVFDVSVTELFGWFFGNGRLAILEKGGEKDPETILTAIERERVSHINFVPSMFNAFTSVLNQGNTGKLSSLKYIFLAGEVLLPGVVETFGRFNTRVALENIYGPTEATIYAGRYSLSRWNGSEAIPIGKPMQNVELYILGKGDDLQPIGVPGELCIGGDGLARGYLNNTKLTAEKFLTLSTRFYRSNRSYKSYFSKKLYKTGDLARWLPDGNIEFLGRWDNQVKIRGFRIELGEIENRLRTFKKVQDSKPITDEDIEKANNLKKITRCKKCLFSTNAPEIEFDEEGVCSICLGYESVEEHVRNYFKNEQDFFKLIEETGKTTGGNNEYDCLLLFSGGKDSSYVLYRLKEMGLKVLAYTLDNGYISETALGNIEKITSGLNVEHLVIKPENMNRVFSESLRSNNNVCPGCWHALNTYAGKTAHEKGIPLVISALSRAQIVDMRLHGLFQGGIFNEKEIEEQLLLFRKRFHSKDNKFSRILKVALEEEVVEQLQFVDFFRYFDTPVLQIKDYLSKKAWIQPGDTGYWSSDCKIKDAGIFMHYRNFGFHFYEVPLSWACRLGKITREAALKEIAFEADLQNINRVLKEIGYYSPKVIKDAVVIDKADEQGNKFLCGYFTSEHEINAPELKDYLARELPDYMIPNYFVKIDQVPQTPSGKIDRSAFPEPSASGAADNYVPPQTEEEKILAEIWSELLNAEKVGIHDNFFSLGGDSISSILVITQAQEKKLNITTQLLFQYPTIDGLIKNMERTGEKDKNIAIDSSQPFGLISKEDGEKVPAGVEDAYPMRLVQADLLMFNEMLHGTSMRHYIAPFKLNGRFNRQLFKKTVEILVERHPIFRTTYDLQNYSQYLLLVHKEIPLPLQVEDLRGLAPEKQEKILKAAKENEITQPIDWGKPGLIRFIVHLLDDETFHFILSYQPSAFDGWSQMSLLSELFLIYNSLLEGNEFPGEVKLEASMKDVAALELEVLASEEAKKFWQGLLAGSRLTKIPRQQRARSRGSSIKPRIYTVDIPPGLSQQLKKAADSLEIPTKAFLMASHCVVMAMLSKNTDIVTGYEVNARPEKKDGDKTLGLYTNIIPFRLKLSEAGNTWADLVKKTHQLDINILSHRRYPLAQIKEQHRGRTLFEVVFNFTHFRTLKNMDEVDNVNVGELTGQDLLPEWEHILRTEFGLNAITDDIELGLYYHSNLFEKEQIRYMGNCYIRVLRQIRQYPSPRFDLDALLREKEEEERARS